ncbi:MAG: protein kinase [Planctomycetes bacterium]|nr:protein kinase [Planctomycetota bacterium]
MIGEKLGEFEIKEEIGKGGMGKVYKAYQMALHRDVAIKILKYELSNEEFVERFDREAKAVASLLHPNILQMYTKGVTPDGVHYFAMEYVDGEDLSSKIKKSIVLPENEAVDIIIQACKGLECAWKQNIIHRDIKPGNLIITKDGVVKIADFGLAKSLEATQKLTQTDVYMGTVNYTSPEQGEGKPLDNRTDIYSLGIVLYKLLTGKVPYEGESPSSVIYKHVYEKPMSPREINVKLSPAVEAVVLKAIAKKPEDRYQSMAEFGEALEKVNQPLSGNNVASKENSTTILASTIKNKKKMYIIVPLLLLMTVGITMIYMLKHDAIEELAEVLVAGLTENMEKGSLDITIGKITMKGTNYSSEYAHKMLRYVGAILKSPKYQSYFRAVRETNITRGKLKLTRGNSLDERNRLHEVVLEGHYSIEKDKVLTSLKLIDKNNNKISESEGSVKRSAISDVSLVPDNIDKVKKIESEIASVTPINNNFRIDLSIDKGNGGIYTEGESIKVLFQSEVDCYLRVLYIDALGNRILMYPTESDPETKLKKGEVYELHKGKKYEVVSPFGAEMIMAFASTKDFDNTGDVNIGGGYRGFVDRMKTSEIITKLRGSYVRGGNGDSMPKRSEAKILLTTVKG